MHWLEQWIMPPRCVLSGEVGAGVDLSAAHIATLQRPQKVCPQCCEHSPDGKICGACLTSPPDYDLTQVGFYFQPPLVELVHQLKYGQEISHARLLTDLAIEYFINNEIEALIAVPIHNHRRRERGFNQAELIAKQMAKSMRIPLLKNAVMRIKATPSQTGLSKVKRQANLNSAFAVDKAKLDGYRRVALIDDVITTGATMQALAKVIKKHSAVDYIEAWAIAKTE